MADVAAPAAAETQVTSAPVESAVPSVIDLKEDSLVRLPGNKEPVKYGEWFTGFQRKHTEATQARSSLQSQLRDAQAAMEQTRQEAERYRAALNLPQHREDPRKGLREKFSQLPYVKGEEAAQLYEAIANEIDGGRQQLQVRDQAIRLLATELTNVKNALGQVLQKNNIGDFYTKIGRYREELGLPEEANEFLAELYSAYEGDDLDSEFPNIAKKRVEQLTAMVNAMNKKRVEEARRNRFVPGKGGQGVPGKAGLPDTSKMNAKDTADALFEAMQSVGDDT